MTIIERHKAFIRMHITDLRWNTSIIQAIQGKNTKKYLKKMPSLPFCVKNFNAEMEQKKHCSQQIITVLNYSINFMILLRIWACVCMAPEQC